ncbi:MAG TPA: hypothetical protein VNI36_09680 [Candidatus Dormibacteraeota bacterium]|nr:hypothetical protein [Candidatus Dormibacteraeota bacterium]
MQRLRYVLADEGLFLQTMDVAIDLLRVAHTGIMNVKIGYDTTFRWYRPNTI